VSNVEEEIVWDAVAITGTSPYFRSADTSKWKDIRVVALSSLDAPVNIRFRRSTQILRTWDGENWVGDFDLETTIPPSTLS